MWNSRRRIKLTIDASRSLTTRMWEAAGRPSKSVMTSAKWWRLRKRTMMLLNRLAITSRVWMLIQSSIRDQSSTLAIFSSRRVFPSRLKLFQRTCTWSTWFPRKRPISLSITSGIWTQIRGNHARTNSRRKRRRRTRRLLRRKRKWWGWLTPTEPPTRPEWCPHLRNRSPDLADLPEIS